MSHIAYRDVNNPNVTESHKVKALLLFMWRAVNSADKTRKAVEDLRYLYNESNIP